MLFEKWNVYDEIEETNGEVRKLEKVNEMERSKIYCGSFTQRIEEFVNDWFWITSVCKDIQTKNAKCNEISKTYSILSWKFLSK